MVGSVLEWFRDDEGWTTPKGRRGEFVGVLFGLPLFVFFVTLETGLPDPGESPLAVLLGLCCGFSYAVYWRGRIRSVVPERGFNMAVSFLFGGGFGLTLLETVHFAAPTVLFVLAVCGTILTLYGAWLLSPTHDGIQPAARGAKPPTALKTATDS